MSYYGFAIIGILLLQSVIIWDIRQMVWHSLYGDDDNLQE